MDTQSPAYQAGIAAAKNGNNINNSYPWDVNEFRAGYQSVSDTFKKLDDKVKSKAHEMLILLDRVQKLKSLIEYSGVISEEHQDEATAINNLLKDIDTFFNSLK